MATVRAGRGRLVENTYSEAEEQRLAANLYGLVRRVQRREFSSHAISVALLQEFHAELFHDVRGHAGRIRSSGFGSETLTFGPNRSSHRDVVPEELDRAFEDALPLIQRLAETPDDAQYEQRAIEVSVWLHARIIEIHPFQDGNGRTSRALMNEILMRLDLPPLAIDAPKEEYRELLNRYYRDSNLQPLIDFAIRLHVDQ